MSSWPPNYAAASQKVRRSESRGIGPLRVARYVAQLPGSEVSASSRASDHLRRRHRKAYLRLRIR